MRFRRSLLLGVVAPLFLGCSEPLAPGATRVELVLQASTTGDAHHPVRVSARAVNSGARAIWHVTIPPDIAGSGAGYEGLSIEWLDPAGRQSFPSAYEDLTPHESPPFDTFTFLLPGEAIAQTASFNGAHCPGDRPWATALTNRESWTVRAVFRWRDDRGHAFVTRKEVSFQWQAR